MLFEFDCNKFSLQQRVFGFNFNWNALNYEWRRCRRRRLLLLLLLKHFLPMLFAGRLIDAAKWCCSQRRMRNQCRNIRRQMATATNASEHWMRPVCGTSAFCTLHRPVLMQSNWPGPLNDANDACSLRGTDFACNRQPWNSGMCSHMHTRIHRHSSPIEIESSAPFAPFTSTTRQRRRPLPGVVDTRTTSVTAVAVVEECRVM